MDKKLRGLIELGRSNENSNRREKQPETHTPTDREHGENRQKNGEKQTSRSVRIHLCQNTPREKKNTPLTLGEVAKRYFSQLRVQLNKITHKCVHMPQCAETPPPPKKKEVSQHTRATLVSHWTAKSIAQNWGGVHTSPPIQAAT